MRMLRKVVWSEGMYLGPHHFQAQSRHVEDALGFSIDSLCVEPHGLTGVEIDPASLRNGTLRIVSARGFFPDGLPFQSPGCDPLPAARRIAELFPPARESVTVLLAIPAQTPSGPVCALGRDGATARYVAEAESYVDDNTGTDETSVLVARKNLRVLLDTEPTEGLVTVPLARVRRDGVGELVLDPRFIPPCVQIGASERLMQLTRQLIELLEGKSSALRAARAASANPSAMFGPGELANAWILHAVSAALGPLRHLWTTRQAHPSELYLELLRLAGALCTFALDSDPSHLPAYEHQDLQRTFDALERHIRGHLEITTPTSCIPIALRPVARYFYEGVIGDRRCFGRSRWVLGVRSPLGDTDVIARVPQLTKVCSSQFIGELVKRALPGPPLSHLPVVPSAIAANVDAHYFAIGKVGPAWEHIAQTGRVGIYLPGEIPDAELSLFVLLDV